MTVCPIEDQAISPVCPMCRAKGEMASLIIKTEPHEFAAPQHIGFVGRCEKCGEEVGIMYTFNENGGRIEIEENPNRSKYEH